ncbi:MAG: hypothetical protein WDO13_03200 [Verrucomicrobiota bacterium]
MKLAATSLAPAFILAGIATVFLPAPEVLAIIWITFYGLGLLATQHFAPRSLVLLGLAFFVTGCGLELFSSQLFRNDSDHRSFCLFCLGTHGRDLRRLPPCLRRRGVLRGEERSALPMPSTSRS